MGERYTTGVQAPPPGGGGRFVFSHLLPTFLQLHFAAPEETTSYAKEVVLVLGSLSMHRALVVSYYVLGTSITTAHILSLSLFFARCLPDYLLSSRLPAIQSRQNTTVIHYGELLHNPRIRLLMITVPAQRIPSIAFRTSPGGGLVFEVRA